MKLGEGAASVHDPLRFVFRPYSLYPTAGPGLNRPGYTLNRNYGDNVFKPIRSFEQCTCHRKPSRPIACRLRSLTILLLAPAGFGIALALLLGFSPDSAMGCYQKPVLKKAAAPVIYTALVTLALSLYVYYTLIENDDDLLTGFLPLSIGLATLLVYYGSIYFLLYRLDPNSFSGVLEDDLLTQALTFMYYSITTFATAQDGDIKPTTLGAKSLVGMEILAFIYVFTLGLVIFTGSKS